MDRTFQDFPIDQRILRQTFDTPNSLLGIRKKHGLGSRNSEGKRETFLGIGRNGPIQTNCNAILPGFPISTFYSRR